MGAEAAAVAGDRALVTTEMRRAREGDPIGHLVHTSLAALYVLLLALSTAPKDWAFGLLIACAAVRLGRTLPCYRVLLRDRMMWLLVAWTLWQALSCAWSSDPLQGLIELRAHRFVLTAFALWPVLEHVLLITAALLAGVVVQNLVQLVQGLGWFGLETDPNDRLRGLLHPIHTGTLCAVALCLHGMAVLRTRRGSTAVLALLGGLLAAAGLVLSGSRGPWIAAAIAGPSMLAWATLAPPVSRRRALLALAGLAVAAAAAWPVAGPVVRQRAAQAWEDVETAMDGRYASDIGRRIASWVVAWDLLIEDPVLGAGAGGFGDGAAGHELGPYLYGARHAHSMYLHVLACTGPIGLLLVTAIAVLGVWRAWRDPPDHLYAGAAAWALLAWLVAAAFDAYQLAGQMFGVLALLLTVTIPSRPVPRAASSPRTR